MSSDFDWSLFGLLLLLVDLNATVAVVAWGCGDTDCDFTGFGI